MARNSSRVSSNPCHETHIIPSPPPLLPTSTSPSSPTCTSNSDSTSRLYNHDHMISHYYSLPPPPHENGQEINTIDCCTTTTTGSSSSLVDYTQLSPSSSPLQNPVLPLYDFKYQVDEIQEEDDMDIHLRDSEGNSTLVRDQTSLTDSKMDLDSKSSCLTDEETMEEKLDPPPPPLCHSIRRHRCKFNSIHDILSNEPGDSMELEEDVCSTEHTYYDPTHDPMSYYPPPVNEAEDLLIAAHALNGLKSGFIQESHKRNGPSDSNIQNGDLPPSDRFISRVASIPIVNSGIRSLSNFYEQTKAHSQMVQYSAEVLEKNLKPISEMAGKYLGAPMREVDSFACRQLDRLESRYPSFRSSDPIAPMLHEHPSPNSSSIGSWQETSIPCIPESPSSSFYAASTSSKKSSFTTENASTSEPQTPIYEASTSFYKSKWQQVTAGAVAAAGAGAAVVSEESMKSLRYCLEWLQYASEEIEQQIQKLRQITLSAVYPMSNNMGVALCQRDWLPDLNAIRKNIAETLRKVVDVVGRYASAFLNNDARNHVRSFILSLPARWASLNADPAESEKGEAQRVMAFASDTASILNSMQDIFSQALSTAEQWLGTLHRVPFVNSLVHPALRAYNKSFSTFSSPSTTPSSTFPSVPPPPTSSPLPSSSMPPSSPPLYPMLSSPAVSKGMTDTPLQTASDLSHAIRKRQCQPSSPTPADYLEPTILLDSASSFPINSVAETKISKKRRKQDQEKGLELSSPQFEWVPPPKTENTDGVYEE